MSKDTAEPVNRLWGGAHSALNKDAVHFASSSDVSAKLPPEQSLIPYDIKTNLAHISSLLKAKVITKDEHYELKSALNQLMSEYVSGDFNFDSTHEDIHSQIESVLTERIGETGKKIHTARSRNDQVTTDMYLYLQDQGSVMVDSIQKLSDTLSKVADQHYETVCPGYTHHQKAVVTSFGDIILGYKVMFDRDLMSLRSVLDIYNYSPLGSGTGYESLISIDTSISAAELGFKAPYYSSIDVISTRGEFEAAFAHSISMFMTHVSMLSETLITLSSQAYKFISLKDEFTTGSSVMPHKKNPDLLEIMKAKNVYVHGLASSLSQLLQAAFLGYNRDSQYSKMIIVQVVDETHEVPFFLSEIVESMTVNSDAMLAAASTDFVTSTGFMEMLIAEKGVALRNAKRLVEKAVVMSKDKGIINLEAFQGAAKAMNLDIMLDENTINDWQNPARQLAVRRRSGV